MTQEDIKKTTQKWLETNQPPHKKLIISCGNHGTLIAIKQTTDWITTWADQLILYSDITNNHTTTRILPNTQTPPTPNTQTPPYTCHCGRTFTKRFAITNHQKTCKPK